MKKMKRFVFLIVLLLFSTIASAKQAVLNIEYAFESEFEPYVTEFRLYISEVGSDTKTLLTAQTDVSSRVWETPVLELPPGKVMNYYLSAVYNDGEEGISNPYQFRLTGKPTIIRISR